MQAQPEPTEKPKEAKSKEEKMTSFMFTFYQEISMDSLEPKRLMQLFSISPEEYTLNLPLIMMYIKKQPRCTYKYELMNSFIEICKLDIRLVIRVILLHTVDKLCLCDCKDFQRYASDKKLLKQKEDDDDMIEFNEMNEEKTERCGIIELLNNEIYDRIYTQLMNVIDWLNCVSAIPNCQGYEVHLKPVSFYSNGTDMKQPETFDKDKELKKECYIQWELDSDPFFGQYQILSLKVTKRFTSSTCQPIELTMKTMNGNKRMLYKQNDVLSIDMAAELSFHIFNMIWKKFTFKGFQHKVDDKITFGKAETYRVIPFQNGGIIEEIGCERKKCLCQEHKDVKCCIDGRTYELCSRYNCNECKTCQNILQLRYWNKQEIVNLIETLSGGFIAGFILGLRDRHLENMLFHLCDHSFTQIDFGFILNKKPVFDSNRMSIPETIRSELNNISLDVDGENITGWNYFISLSASSYLQLRRNVGLLSRLITLLFSFDKDITDEAVNECLSHSFYLESSEAASIDILINHLQVFSIRKMIKDSQHEFLRFIRSFK